MVSAPKVMANGLAVKRARTAQSKTTKAGIGMQITKTVSKQVVNPTNGEKVTRKAHVTFEVPNYTVTKTTEKVNGEDKEVEKVEGLDIANAIATFGGSAERLIQFAIAGLWNTIRTNESNDLAKADKASKAMKKAVMSLKAVSPSITDEQLRAMLMSNPAMAADFQSQPFELEVNKNINMADVKPSILDPGVQEDADTEEEEATA